MLSECSVHLNLVRGAEFEHVSVFELGEVGEQFHYRQIINVQQSQSLYLICQPSLEQKSQNLIQKSPKNSAQHINPEPTATMKNVEIPCLWNKTSL